MRRRATQWVAGAALGCLVALTACSGDAGAGAGTSKGSGAASASTSAGAGASGAGSSGAGTASPLPPVTSAECAPGPDRQVQDLPDVTIPAVHIPGVSIAREEVAGKVAAAVDVPPVDLPAQVVDAGCVIKFAAPAGCLGAVQVTGVRIPAARLPGYSFTDDKGQVTKVPDVEVPETVVPGSKVAQVCQVKAATGQQYVASVYRAGLHRPAAVRKALYRPSSYRAAICEASQCTKDAAVPDAGIPQVSVPEAFAGDATLEGYAVGDAQVLKNGDSNAYLTPTDILFDLDSASLKPVAIPVLQAIVKDIAKSGLTGTIRVEGHTDDTGTAEHNLELSKARAQSVADWLVKTAGLDAARIKVTGYGETVPAKPNDSEANRKANRRVVIAVDKVGTSP